MITSNLYIAELLVPFFAWILFMLEGYNKLLRITIPGAEEGLALGTYNS